MLSLCPCAYLSLPLIIKIVSAYGEGEGTVFGDPITCCYTGIHKEEDLVVNGISLKADLGGDDACLRRGVIDGSHGNGRELCAAVTVENNAVDSIGILLTVLSVHNNVSNGYLPDKTLSPCFRIDYPCQPIKVIGAVKGAACTQGLARCCDQHRPCVSVPVHLRAERLGERADGNEEPSVYIKDTLNGEELSSVCSYVKGASRNVYLKLSLNDRCS